MQISLLPKPVYLDDVDPGSLVLAPDDNGNGYQWAIRTSGGKLFLLDTREEWPRGGALADFGKEFIFSIDPDQYRQLPRVLDAKDPPPGSLYFFSEDGVIFRSIVIGKIELIFLQVLVFEKGEERKGEIKTIKQNAEDGVVFPSWRIGLKDAADRDGYKWVYKFSANDNE